MCTAQPHFTHTQQMQTEAQNKESQTADAAMAVMNERQDLGLPKGDGTRHVSRCARADPVYGTGIKGSVTWTYYYVVVDGVSDDDARLTRKRCQIPEPYNNTVAFPNDGAGWVPGAHMYLWDL